MARLSVDSDRRAPLLSSGSRGTDSVQSGGHSGKLSTRGKELLVTNPGPTNVFFFLEEELISAFLAQS